MRCDACGQHRLYMQPRITLRRSPTGLTATVEPEKTPERVPPPGIVGRYHVKCYAAKREGDPDLPRPTAECDRARGAGAKRIMHGDLGTPFGHKRSVSVRWAVPIPLER
jgi:hypothetical protein